MKITRIETIPVGIPLVKSFVTSLGSIKRVDNVVIKVYTDNDIVGIGESPGSDPPFTGETQESIKVTIDKYLAPLLIGEDPFNTERIMSKLTTIPRNTCAKSGIDMALYDIVGKALEIPVFKLLGGCYRDKIPLGDSISLKEKDEMVREAINFMKSGLRAIKIKIGSQDPKKDMENVTAIRDALGPNVKIGVDANQGYSPATAVKVLKEMEKCDLQLIEQPVPAWDLEGMARVAKALDTPIMADESVFTIQDAIKVIRMESADIINIKIQKPGGLYNSKKLAAIAEAADVPCFGACLFSTRIATAAAAHFVASTKNIDYECEIYSDYPEPYLKEDIVKTPFRVERGFLEVPKGVGLGIQLDEEKLKECVV